jgi:hypothetical protein
MPRESDSEETVYLQLLEVSQIASPCFLQFGARGCGQGVSISGKAPGAGMDLTQVAHYQGGAVGVWRRCRFDAWTVSSGHVTTSL